MSEGRGLGQDLFDGAGATTVDRAMTSPVERRPPEQ